MPESTVTAATVSTFPSTMNASGMYIPTDPNSFIHRLESKAARAVNRINLARQKPFTLNELLNLIPFSRIHRARTFPLTQRERSR